MLVVEVLGPARVTQDAGTRTEKVFGGDGERSRRRS